MFSRRPRIFSNSRQIVIPNDFMAANELNYASALYSTSSGLTGLPRKLKKSERKPWVTHITELKRKARLEKQERIAVREVTLKPPENGLLVKELIPVAHQVLAARMELIACVSQVARSIPIYSCRVCGEVHVGDPPHKIRTCDTSGSQKNKEHTWEKGGVQHVLPVVESFHMYDRLGRAVSHNEWLQVDRLPAIVELCIQAGVDILEYPTRRQQFPAYRVAGKILDFEKRFPKYDFSPKDIKPLSFWEMPKQSNGYNKSSNSPHNSRRDFAVQGVDAWEKMRSIAIKLMQKYAVQTCGYCPEVQVGPKGHRLRQCQAYKHQMRDGQHAWQEATIDDLVPPVYVWHVRDIRDRLLIDSLKWYYGKLPAVVELFVQAGAPVRETYCGMMREDVVVPGLDEEKLVV